MTTEHVSVPRELFDMAREQIERQRLAALEYGLIAVAEAHAYALHKIDAILSRVTPSDGSPMECLSELMRGLEIPPAAAANMQPHGFYAIGRAIAEQAKQAGKTSAPRVVTSNDDNATSLPAARVTDGWKLVPLVPTAEMEDAAFDTFEIDDAKTQGFNSGTEARNAIYKAMLAAAPQAGERG